MKIEAKLLASLRTPELKKIRAPNFFIFSTDSEKSLLDPEPVGRLLKTKKSSTTREKCATLATCGVVLVGHRMLLYDERTTTRSIDDDCSKATLIIKV